MSAGAEQGAFARSLAAARIRVGRLQPGRVDKGLLWVVILCWISTIVLAIFVLAGSADRDDDLAVLDRWLSETGGGGAASAAFVAALTIRADQVQIWIYRALRLVAVALLAGFPLVALSTAGLTIQGICAALGLAGAVTSHVVAMTSHGAVRVSAILAAMFVMIAWAALLLGLFLATMDTRPILITSMSLSALSFGFIQVTGYAAVLLVAAPRRDRLNPLIRRPASRWVVIAVAALIIAIVVLRLTVARDVFGTADGDLWTLWAPDGIPHAIVTAVVIYLVVVASVNRPYRPTGRGVVSWILIISAAASAILFAALTIIASFRSVAVGTSVVSFNYDATWRLATEVTVLGVLSTVVFLFGRRRPRSIGFAIAVVALVYTLFVAFVQMAALSTDRSIWEFPYWSGPVPVIVALIGIVLARTIVAAIRREPRDQNPALISLLVTPVVLMHGGTLIPLFLESQISGPILVAGTVLALFWFMPPTAAERTRHTAVVLVASGIQVGLLIAWTMNERATIELPGEGDLVRASGTLMLALPLSVAVSAFVGMASTRDTREPTHWNGLVSD